MVTLFGLQLLAANAGIPNVVVSSYLIDELKRKDGSSIVLAASAGGKALLASDTKKWNSVIPKENPDSHIEPVNLPLDKLDLTKTDITALRKI